MLFGQNGTDLIHGNDGDDYIEGGAEGDTLYGGLGQDDIIGGSSSLFGFDTPELRADGSDTIYGGTGDPVELARNAYVSGDHGLDADVILGDNGQLVRLVDSGGYLRFAYDTYAGSLAVIPRGVELLDYTLGGPDYDAAAFMDIGAGDRLYGEAGNDTIYGMTGDDIIYGNGQDDDLIGGWGHDWISGDTGDDGILGDDGHVFTSRNGTAEPLYGIAAYEQTEISGGPALNATIYLTGQLLKTALLTPFNLAPDGDVYFQPQHADDIIYGGLGNDFLHGGSGDDAISGSEALPLYYDNPFNPGNILNYNDKTTLFAAYNPNAPMAKVMVDAKGNFVTTGGVDFLLNFEPAVAPEPDNDMIFGDLGNDWLVGGPGKDNLFGGLGNDLLNADDDHESGPDNTEVDIPPESLPADYYDDIVFGGGGRDVLIASSAGDIMIDWIGEFNSYVVPTSKFGPGTVIRYYTKAFVEFLYQLGISCGLDTTAGMRVPGADPARYFEPYGELGMVLQGDPIDQDVGAPRDPQPGNKGGKK